MLLKPEITNCFDAPLILVRGAPGSGKSTIAECIASVDGRHHFEADQYFMVGGEYHWSREHQKLAHKWCQYRTLVTLEKGDKVVVSNTFTRQWEMEPYLLLDFDTKVIRSDHNFGNIHFVPKENVQAMRNRFEDFEGEILV